jgi:hypothetical protein
MSNLTYDYGNMSLTCVENCWSTNQTSLELFVKIPKLWFESPCVHNNMCAKWSQQMFDKLKYKCIKKTQRIRLISMYSKY